MAITLDSDKTSVYWMRDVPHKNFVRRTTPPLSVSSSSDGIMITLVTLYSTTLPH